MRCLFLLLAVSVSPVMADAYKCKSPTGQVIFTEKPCDPGYTNARSVSSSPVDEASVAQARADVQRQKAWNASRDQMHAQDAIVAHKIAESMRGPEPVQPTRSVTSSLFDRPGCTAFSSGCGGSTSVRSGR